MWSNGGTSRDGNVANAARKSTPYFNIPPFDKDSEEHLGGTINVEMNVTFARSIISVLSRVPFLGQEGHITAFREKLRTWTDKRREHQISTRENS